MAIIWVAGLAMMAGVALGVILASGGRRPKAPQTIKPAGRTGRVGDYRFPWE